MLEKMNNRATVEVWGQKSFTVRRDRRKEVAAWVVTWHISHPNTVFQQSISFTTLLNIQNDGHFVPSPLFSLTFPAYVEAC